MEGAQFGKLGRWERMSFEKEQIVGGKWFKGCAKGIQ